MPRQKLQLSLYQCLILRSLLKVISLSDYKLFLRVREVTVISDVVWWSLERSDQMKVSWPARQDLISIISNNSASVKRFRKWWWTFLSSHLTCNNHQYLPCYRCRPRHAASDKSNTEEEQKRRSLQSIGLMRYWQWTIKLSIFLNCFKRDPVSGKTESGEVWAGSLVTLEGAEGCRLSQK